jgi:apolipoprotein N-acyltransferase
MTPRRLLQIIVALETLIAPLATVAQPLYPGSVTTAPVSSPAPVMGMTLLALLAVVLGGAGAYLLRRTSGDVIAKVVFVVALTTVAGIGYAFFPMGGTYTVEGTQCGMQTVQVFDASAENTLESHCPNLIRIVDIQVGPCPTLSDPPGPCSIGQVLANNESCTLPVCGFLP